MTAAATRPLAGWLARLETLHPAAIELGLARVEQVRQALRLEPGFSLVIVGGTNGKGSTCAYIEAIARAAGYRTGLYTSPHLLHYNERVRIDGVPAGDAEIVAAFERVEAARGDVSLTYFEFGTLGAMLQFVDAQVDVGILEVGLGGRLDAVNIFDADVAIVTSVDLDHMEYLGGTREKIGFEKAGIFRARRTAICADPAPPASVIEHACAVGADLRRVGRDYRFDREDDCWTYRGPAETWTDLPLPALAGPHQLGNAAAAVAAFEALRAQLPASGAAICEGLSGAHVAGRFERLAGEPEVIVDVAHNPEAARALAAALDDATHAGHTFAVVGMLRDKDADAVFAVLASRIDRWWTCRPDSPRAQDAETLATTLRPHVGSAPVEACPDVLTALCAAKKAAAGNDRILVFGSFHTVAPVLDHAATQQ